VKDAIFQHRWVHHISGAHTTPVLHEYLDLWEKLESVQLRALVGDRFVWRWTPDGVYSDSSSYRSFFLSISSLLGASEVWKASAPLKVKFFFWLALHRRIWTADRRKRHGLQDSAECVLCGQEDETMDHLLASCVFTRELWFRLLRPSGWEQLSPSSHSPLSTLWMDGQYSVPAQLRRGFDSTVLLVSWRLWKERNSRTFDNSVSMVQQVAKLVLEETDEWIAAGFVAIAEFLVASSVV